VKIEQGGENGNREGYVLSSPFHPLHTEPQEGMAVCGAAMLTRWLWTLAGARRRRCAPEQQECALPVP
jgi:hypothetical protein